MGSVRRASWRPYLLYIGLNVVVSAVTVLLILSLWGGRGAVPTPTPLPTLDVIAQVASAIPTITPTTPPSPTPVTYTVRVGDTLLDIANEFGLTMEALMAANGLNDANTLSAGQVLVIPIVEGGAEATPRPATSAAPRATATALQEAGQVVINGLEGAGDLDRESVRLLNLGGEVSMAGWILEDGEGNSYHFPGFTFYSTGAVDVHTKAGVDTTIDLYWGLDAPVWTPGKQITLRDTSGVVQSTFQIPQD